MNLKRFIKYYIKFLGLKTKKGIRALNFWGVKASLLFILLHNLNSAYCLPMHSMQTNNHLSKNDSLENPKIDSLLNLLKTAKEETTCLNILNELCREYNLVNPDSALEYGKQALSLAKELDSKQGITASLVNIGNVHENQGNYKEAIDCYQQSLKITEDIKDKVGIAKSLNNIGNIYFYKGNYENALNYFLRSLKIFQELEDKSGVASNLNNIGNIYSRQRHYKKALEYYRQSLEIDKELLEQAERSENPDAIGRNKQGIASELSNIGNIYTIQGKYDEAISYYLKALKASKELGDKHGIAGSLNNIGAIYYYKGNYEKTLDYFLQSLKIYEELGYKEGITANVLNIGSTYANLGNYEKAVENIQRSLTLAKEIGTKEHIKEAYKALAEIYSEQNNFKIAYQHFRLYSAMKDTLYNEESSRQITEMQIKYETEKKEKEIEIQKLQIRWNNYFIIGLIIMVILIIIIAILLIRQNKLRADQKTIALEQKLLRTQMNPHFIFNSLIAIQNYMYENNPEKAGIYLSKFAELIRLILENSRQEYVLVEKEIKTLEHYLELQGIRFKDKFDYNIEVDPKIDRETMLIPPMLAQPFIENSIEHGIQHIDKNTKGQINIRLYLEDNLILFELTDNGVGRKKANELKQLMDGRYKSLATTITKERLSNLNKGRSQKIKLDIIDLEDQENCDEGTKVTFYIPFKYIELK